MKKLLITAIAWLLIISSAACGAAENGDRSEPVSAGTSGINDSGKESGISTSSQDQAVSSSQPDKTQECPSSEEPISESPEPEAEEEPYEKISRVFEDANNISFEMPELQYKQYYDAISGKTLPYRLYVPQN